MNKKIFLITFITISILLICLYFFIPKQSPDIVLQSDSMQYIDSAHGISFTVPGGYIVEENKLLATSSTILSSVSLIPKSEYQANPPQGGEGSASLSLYVIKNTLKQSPSVWADANKQYSYINLKSSVASETVVSGANAVSYTADGLFPSKIVIVAHAGYIYLFHGQFMDPQSNTPKDFQSIIDSVSFMPITQVPITSTI